MNTITVETSIQGKLNKVWEAWTNPKDIQNWNHASDDWECPYAENDLQINGKFLFRMSAKDGSTSFDFNGTYTNIKNYELIEYLIEGGRKVSVTFERLSNGQIKVTETFEAEDINSEELQKNGWQAILDNFKLYVQAALLLEIKARFRDYRERHEGVDWDDVQASLEADPALLWSLNEMEIRGHEPDVYKEDEEAYYFGTCSEQVPRTARNIVYDADAQAWIAAHQLERARRIFNADTREWVPQDLKEVCNGNAVDIATAMGIDLMSKDDYMLLQTLGRFDLEEEQGSGSWAYLKTPADIRKPRNTKEPGKALCGFLSDGNGFVGQAEAADHNDSGGFRGSLRVSKRGVGEQMSG